MHMAHLTQIRPMKHAAPVLTEQIGMPEIDSNHKEKLQQSQEMTLMACRYASGHVQVPACGDGPNVTPNIAPIKNIAAASSKQGLTGTEALSDRPKVSAGGWAIFHARH